MPRAPHPAAAAKPCCPSRPSAYSFRLCGQSARLPRGSPLKRRGAPRAQLSSGWPAHGRAARPAPSSTISVAPGYGEVQRVSAVRVVFDAVQLVLRQPAFVPCQHVLRDGIYVADEHIRLKPCRVEGFQPCPPQWKKSALSAQAFSSSTPGASSPSTIKTLHVILPAQF